MKTKFILFFSVFSMAVSAQDIWITSRETGNQQIVFPRKVKAVVTRDGEYFEGKIRPFPEYLIVGDNSVAYKEIGFLEVKKLEGRSFISTPLKWIGGGLTIIGGVATGFAFQAPPEENWGLLGSGVAVAGTGVLLYRLGEKSEPGKNHKITALHTKEWQFSYGIRP